MTVNAFVVRDGGETALIDTGFPMTGDAMVAGLDTLGLRPADIDQVLYTHSHPDHMGGGVALGAALGGSHVFWSGTAPALGNYHDYYEALPSWPTWFGTELPDSEIKDAVLAFFEREPRRRRFGAGALPRPRTIEFGAEVRVGSLRFVCIDGRGHDPFHAGWLEPTRRWLFSGDVVLRNATPMLPVLRDELPTYRRTLRRWQDTLEVDRLFPGHGRPRDDFDAAVAASYDHTRSLYESVRAGLGDGVFDVTDLIRSAGDRAASAMQRAFVSVGATVSQLEELREHELVRRRPDRRWEAVAPIPEFEAFAGG